MTTVIFDYINQFLQLAALLGAVSAAVSFVRAQLVASEKERQKTLSNWRKVTLHQVLQTSPTFLTVEEITSKLRSSSFETDFQVQKTEIDERNVRLLLLEMLKDDVIAQIPGDRYGISHYDFVREVQERVATGMRISRSIVSIVIDAPGAFTTEKISEKISKSLEMYIPPEEVFLALNELVRQGVITQDQRGYWYPGGSSHYSNNAPTLELQMSENAG